MAACGTHYDIASAIANVFTASRYYIKKYLLYKLSISKDNIHYSIIRDINGGKTKNQQAENTNGNQPISVKAKPSKVEGDRFTEV